MKRSRWISLVLALLLIIGGVVAILYATLLNYGAPSFSRMSLVIALFGLSLATFAALTLILREIAVRLRIESTLSAREATRAEHRRFLRRLDHELKNPVMALRAGLASLSLTASSDQSETITLLNQEVLRLSRLVTDLRKLAELETLSLEMHSIPVATFLHEIVELDQSRIQSQGRNFHFMDHLPANREIMLYGDQSLLQLAIHNVIDNAIKYSQPDDTITLRATLADADLLIQIQDTGGGIAPDELELVWEELYRGGNTRDISPGHGIGLALVRSIIERHNGVVDLVSQLGSGTTVSLYLPLD